LVDLAACLPEGQVEAAVNEADHRDLDAARAPLSASCLRRRSVGTADSDQPQRTLGRLPLARAGTRGGDRQPALPPQRLQASSGQAPRQHPCRSRSGNPAFHTCRYAANLDTCKPRWPEPCSGYAQIGGVDHTRVGQSLHELERNANATGGDARLPALRVAFALRSSLRHLRGRSPLGFRGDRSLPVADST
jgi:hypothetical protein